MEPGPDDSVRAAALSAMESQGLNADNWPIEGTGDEGEEQTPSPEASEEPEPATPPAGEEESVERTPGTPENESPEDVPTEYFGVDLSDLPPEKRAEIIGRFKEQDRYVQSVQQRAADLEKSQQERPQAQPEAQPEPEAELSDDDIMSQIGVSQDDEMYELKKEMLLPTAKETLQLKQQMQELVMDQQLEKLERHWNSTLDQLEAQHGKLPISREELIQIAVENQITDPVDAYARVHLTGRQTLSTEVERFKQEAATAAEEQRKRPPSTQSPRPAEAAKVEPPELLDPKESARRAAEKMGLDWGKVLNSTQ